MVGGQAGVSGHIKVGDNVQIGGGSGVIKNIPSNTKVMGYPARNIRNFLKLVNFFLSTTSIFLLMSVEIFL